MNNKHYIGLKSKSTTLGIKLPPISKVILNGDNDAVFEAGDDTGEVLETYVPTATQRMATDILNKVKGFAYQGYTTQNAVLDPTAELGDGITVKGVYGILASREFSFTPKMFENVSAPIPRDDDHEYQYKGTYAQQISNKVQLGQLYYGTSITRKSGIEVVKTDGTSRYSRVILNSDTLAFYNNNGREAFYFDSQAGVFRLTQYANVEDAILGSQAYSSLELTAEQLSLKIQDAERNITSLQTTATGLAASIQDAEYNITSLQVTADGLTTSVRSLGTGISTLEQKVDSFTLRVQNGVKSSTIYLDAGSINLSSQDITFSGVVTFTDLKTKGSTVINGSNITTGIIDAQYLNLSGAITFSDLSSGTQTTINNISNTANTASTNASSALKDAADAAAAAGNAATAASNAQGTANTAVSNAATAQSTANTAVSNAATAQSTANTANTNATTAYNKAVEAATAASNAKTAADNATTKLSSWTYSGTTYINGAMLATGTVVASTLAGGSVNILTSASKVAGQLTCSGASSANFAVHLESYGALRLVSANGSDIYLHRGTSIGSGHYVHINSTGVHIGNTDLRPTGDGTYDCGYPSNKWNDIYAKNTTIQTSDRNEKYHINYDVSRYNTLFDSLKPCSFKFQTNESNRTHLGMIAQDVEASLLESNIDSQDFAPFVKYMHTDEDGNILNQYGYGLRYTEFIPLLIHQVQALKQRVTELEANL